MDILRSKVFLFVFALVFLNGFIWYAISASSLYDPKLYFLNIGQGDSQLVRLPSGQGRDIRLLIDGGPDKSVLAELERSLPADDHYLDLLIMTHAEADHLNGFIEILKKYKVGAFIYNGRKKETANWAMLADELRMMKIPVVILGEGDRIRYGDTLLTFLSPGPEFIKSEALNDTGLVSLLEVSGTRVLFTADIDARVEDFLRAKYDLDVDILKIAHHGSRFSTSADFLNEATPRIAVIQVGKNNRYGHPSADVVGRLLALRTRVYRSDEHGKVEITLKNGSAEVSKDR